MKTKQMMMEKKDMKKDKKMGIKEGSKKDMMMDMPAKNVYKLAKAKVSIFKKK